MEMGLKIWVKNFGKKIFKILGPEKIDECHHGITLTLHLWHGGRVVTIRRGQEGL